MKETRKTVNYENIDKIFEYNHPQNNFCVKTSMEQEFVFVKRKNVGFKRNFLRMCLRVEGKIHTPPLP